MFADKLMETIESVDSRVCCGIDPRIKEVEETYKDNARYWISPSLVRDQVAKYGKERGRSKAVEIFFEKLIRTVDEHVAVYKPNLAYFASLGETGLVALKHLINFIHTETDKMVILDCKLSDIASSALHYGISYFDYFKADAVTLNPYLGSDTIEPLLGKFVREGKGVFVLCKTSNPSAVEFQDKEMEQLPLFTKVAEKIAEWGSTYEGESGWSNVGAVVGATYPQQLANLREKLKGNPLLIPGLGIQGGKPRDVARLGTNGGGLGAVFNSSRGIDFAYQKLNYPEEKWDQAAEQSAKRLKEQINEGISF